MNQFPKVTRILPNDPEPSHWLFAHLFDEQGRVKDVGRTYKGLVRQCNIAGNHGNTYAPTGNEGQA